MRVVLAAGILSVAVCGGLATFMARGHRPRDLHSDDPTGEELLRLETSVPVPIPPALHPVRVSPPVRSPLAPNQHTAVMQAEPTTIVATLVRRVTHEFVDSDAARTASALTDEVYGAKIEGTSVVSATCAKTLCQIDLEYAAKVDHNALVLRVGNLPSFASGAYYQHDERNGRLTVFVARAGEHLFAPTPD